MKGFIQSLLVFLLIPLGYFVAIFFVNRILIDRHPPVLGVNVLIMGDSHLMTSLNPNQWKKAANVSQTAESYFTTFHKLKALAQHNDLDTVLLGFSYSNFGGFNDTELADPGKAMEMLGRLYPITQPGDFAGLNMDKASYVKVMARRLLLYPTRHHQPYVGRFEGLPGHLDMVRTTPERVIQTHFFHHGRNTGISGLAPKYLDSIVNISRLHKIHLILVTTPLHAEYRKLIPENILEQYTQQRQRMEGAGVKVVDYSQLDLPDDQFADFDHLNLRGSRFLSLKLKSDLFVSSGPIVPRSP